MKACAKTLSVMAALAAALCITGCAYVYRSSPDALQGVEVKGAGGPSSEIVYITTSGYYILWSLPIASGDLRWDGQTNSIKGGTRFFCDMVGVVELQNALLKMAESRNCDVVDVTYYDHDDSYSGPSQGGLLGALFGSSQMGVSAVMVPRAPAVEDVKSEGGAE